jgi:hypothetical protein
MVCGFQIKGERIPIHFTMWFYEKYFEAARMEE